MPKRSLSSSILRWPDKAEVDRAVRRWADDVKDDRVRVVAIGYFGSYARDEYARIASGPTRFASVLKDETCWFVGPRATE